MKKSLPSFGKKQGSKAQKEVEGEDKHVLATRYISFDEELLLVLQHLPHRPTRNYEAFKPKNNELRARALPTLQWDCQVTMAFKV